MHSGRTLALFYLQAMYCFTFKFIFHVLEMTATNKHLSTLGFSLFLKQNKGMYVLFNQRLCNVFDSFCELKAILHM